MASDSPVAHPREWRVVQLGDIALKIGSGATPRGGEEAYLSQRFNFALVRSQNVFDRHFDTSGLAFISDEQAGSLKGVVLQPRDLLLNITGDGITFSRCCVVPNEVLPACVNQHVSIIRVKQDVADPGYVLAHLTHPATKTYIESFNAGGSRRAITKGHIESFRIALPPVMEQRAIAHILDTLDDRIDLNRRMNETLEGMARALFKSWFIYFDPIRAKNEGRDVGLPKPLADLFPDSFEDSEGDDVPKGWSVLGLDEIADFLNGLALQKFPPQGDRFLPVIKIAQLRTENTLGADRASAELAPEYVVNDGDVLFSWSGSLECVLWAGGRGALNQHLFKVTSESYPKWFYFSWIRQHLDEFRGIAAGKATTMGHIQRGHLSAAKVLVPSDQLLTEMNRHFAPLIDRVIESKVASKNLAAIRDTLLPKLVSGELRVPDVERIVGGQM
jgi:type I restriction enzyme, S subunit